MENLTQMEWNEQPVYQRKNGLFVRFGCFLTGYNCRLLRQCSEASYKKLKGFVAGMLIIMIIWWWVGYLLALEYFKLNSLYAALFGLMMVFIVWMVERMIILFHGQKWVNGIFRLGLGLLMAVVGATIIDQWMFREDIQKKKTFVAQEEVARLLPARTSVIREEIAQLDSTIAMKEQERTRLLKELERKPVIAVPTVSYTKDSTGKIVSRSVTVKKVENPKFEVYNRVEEDLKLLKSRRDTLNNRLIHVREVTEKELLERKGFLDELKLLKSILLDDKTAFYFWAVWFGVLLSFELLVAMIKIFGKKTDYEYLVEKMNRENMR